MSEQGQTKYDLTTADIELLQQYATVNAEASATKASTNYYSAHNPTREPLSIEQSIERTWNKCRNPLTFAPVRGSKRHHPETIEALQLWRKIQICADLEDDDITLFINPDTKQTYSKRELIITLFNKLGLNSDLREKPSWWDWAKYKNIFLGRSGDTDNWSLNTKKNYIEEVLQQLGWLTPPYNEALEYVNNCVDYLLDQSKSTLDTILEFKEKNPGNKDGIKNQRERLNNLINLISYIEQHRDLPKKDVSANDSARHNPNRLALERFIEQDSYLRKLHSLEDEPNAFQSMRLYCQVYTGKSTRAYKRVNNAFMYALGMPYQQENDKKHIDSNTLELISYLKKIGGYYYVQAIYKKFFVNNDGQSVSGKLDNFAKFVYKILLELSDSDLEPYGISEQLKHSSILKPLADLFNKWSRHNNIDISIVEQKDHYVSLDQCHDLIQQLSATIYEHPGAYAPTVNGLDNKVNNRLDNIISNHELIRERMLHNSFDTQNMHKKAFEAIANTPHMTAVTQIKKQFDFSADHWPLDIYIAAAKGKYGMYSDLHGHIIHRLKAIIDQANEGDGSAEGGLLKDALPLLNTFNQVASRNALLQYIKGYQQAKADELKEIEKQIALVSKYIDSGKSFTAINYRQSFDDSYERLKRLYKSKRIVTKKLDEANALPPYIHAYQCHDRLPACYDYHLLRKLKDIKQQQDAETQKRLAELRKDIESLEEETLIPLKHRQNPFTVEEAEDENFEEYRIEKHKSRLSYLGDLFALALSLGQAALGAYACIFLFPMFSYFALPLAIILFACTFLVNFTLFRYPTRDVLVSLLLRGDIFAGYKTKSGKIFMGVLWVFAISFAATMGLLVYLSIVATIGALTIGLSMLAPALLPYLGSAIVVNWAIPIISFIFAFTTFIGFASLMFTTMANVVTGFCNKLEQWFPSIEKEGWGIDGLIKGLWKDKGNIPKLIKQSCLDAWHKLKYPTNDKTLPASKQWQLRLDLILRTGLTALFWIAGMVIVIWGTIVTVNAWHAEIAAILEVSAGLSPAAASWLSYGLTWTMTAVVEFVFNLRNMPVYMKFLADVATNVTMSVGSYLSNKIKLAATFGGFWKSCGNDIKHVGKYFSNWYTFASNNPKQALANIGKNILVFVVIPFALVFNALSQALFVLKNNVLPDTVTIDGLEQEIDVTNVFSDSVSEEVDLSAIGATSIIEAAAALDISVNCNGCAINDENAGSIPTYIPLMDAQNDADYCDNLVSASDYNPDYVASSNVITDSSLPIQDVLDDNAIYSVGHKVLGKG